MSELAIADVVGFLASAQFLSEDRTWELSAAYLDENTEGNGPGFAHYLVRSGILTPYQADRIAAGEAAKLLLGPYCLQHPVGQGSLGTTFRAIHRTDLKSYALMVLPLRSIWHVHLAKSVVHQFAELPGLPSVIPLTDIDSSNQFHYLAWPFVDGETVEKVIAKKGPLPIEEALRIAATVVESLAYCRRHQIIHGCLRPSKVMLRSDGSVATIEWGVGAILSENITDDESFLDTISSATAVSHNLDCVPPELIVDPLKRTEFGDQYSFGCTLYFLCSGHFPFPEGNLVDKMISHQTQTPERLNRRARKVPDSIADLVAKLLEKDPKNRYPDWNEPLRILRQAASDLYGKPNTDGGRLVPEVHSASDVSHFLEAFDSNQKTARPGNANPVASQSESLITFELADSEGETENSYGVAAGQRRGSTGDLPYIPIEEKPVEQLPKRVEEVQPIVLKGRTKTDSKLTTRPESKAGLKQTEFSFDLPAPISKGDISGEFVHPDQLTPRSWWKRLASWFGSWIPFPSRRAETLQVCLFGTPQTAAGQTIRLQAFVHPPKTFRSITTVARAFAPGAELLVTGSTDQSIAIGAALSIHLGIANAGVATPLVNFVYNGETQPKSFDVHITWECPAGTVNGVLSVALDQVRIARLPFQLVIESRSTVHKRSTIVTGR